MWWKYLIGVVILMHGVGHLAGVGAALVKGGSGFSTRPWIFSGGVLYSGPVDKLWTVVWLAAVAVLEAGAVNLRMVVYQLFAANVYHRFAAEVYHLRRACEIPFARPVTPYRASEAVSRFDSICCSSRCRP